MPVKELCRKGGFSDATFYKWRAKFGGMDIPDERGHFCPGVRGRSGAVVSILTANSLRTRLRQSANPRARSAITTPAAPSAANRGAIAAPIPLAPPVMIATLSWTFISSFQRRRGSERSADFCRCLRVRSSARTESPASTDSVI